MFVTLRRLCLPACAGVFLAACSLAGSNPPAPEAFGSAATAPAVIPTTAASAVPPVAAGGAAAPTVSAGGSSAPVALAPEGRPSAAEGAALFAEHCAPCHGATGNADGAMTANIPTGADSVPKFALPEKARAASPQAWFGVVTQGRLDKFMPPFQDKLNDAQRWNVVSFLYTLSAPQTQLDAGQAIYTADCARCHGAAGQGDGAEAAGMAMRDFTDPALAATFSPRQLFDALTGGAVPGHAFEATLSEDERWNVVSYVAAFAYDYFAPGAPLPVQTGIVTGRVANGTPDQALNAAVTVNLIGFDQASGVMETLTGTVDAQGEFQFADVPYQSGRQFVVAAEYKGITYHSSIVEFASGLEALDVPVTVYETTDQTGALRINRVHTFVLFEVPDFVTIGQLYVISNLGQRTFLPDNGRTVEYALPAGATDLQVQDGAEGTTFFRTAAGFVDTVPVLPGEAVSQMLFSFRLPYKDGLKFEQPMLYAVENVNVMIGGGTVTLTGDEFVAGDAQDVSGQTFLNYSRAGLEAGAPLAFELKGPSALSETAAAPAGITASDPTTLAVGLGALACVLLGIGVWWWRRTPGTAQSAAGSAKAAASREELLQAIAELDDEHAAGKVSAAEYEKERAWLKQELKKIWTATHGR